MVRSLSPVGRFLNPVIRQELENLDKDADSRKSAMKALKSYVKDLDSKAIPLFLAQVSETKETGSSSGEYTISLYEVLARVHGTNIVPQIDNIMATIIKTLTSRAGSFALHQACSKVVPAIARYGIDPTTPEDKKRHIIHSLCKPLSDSLLGSHESLSSGAALCLKALVDSDNWRFASDGMVNEVCLRVVAALEEKPTQTNSHMGLVMSLAKHNGLVVEAYSRLLIQSGLRILKAGIAESNSQKRLSAIQMLNFLMKCLDVRSILSELGLIIEEMENCQSDQMAYVSGAAFEALQTAKRIALEKGSKYGKDTGSITGSNFTRPRRNIIWGCGDRSPLTASPESQTVDSFFDSDSLIESPISTRDGLFGSNYDRRSVNRKLWRNENGGVDVSLKDGLFSDAAEGSVLSTNKTFNDQSGENDNRGEQLEAFSGFFQGSPINGRLRSATPSPQRSRAHLNVGDINIFTTPRKLVHSLQNSSDIKLSENQARRFRSPSANIGRNPLLQNGSYEQKMNENSSSGSHQCEGGSESVSSTDDASDNAFVAVSAEVVPEIKTETKRYDVKLRHRKIAVTLFGYLLFISFAVFASLLLIADHEEGYNIVPT